MKDESLFSLPALLFISEPEVQVKNKVTEMKSSSSGKEQTSLWKKFMKYKLLYSKHNIGILL